jgi:hypothetical protein
MMNPSKNGYDELLAKGIRKARRLNHGIRESSSPEFVAVSSDKLRVLYQVGEITGWIRKPHACHFVACSKHYRKKLGRERSRKIRAHRGDFVWGKGNSPSVPTHNLPSESKQ